jgi:hypothetical protein
LLKPELTRETAAGVLEDYEEVILVTETNVLQLDEK